MASSGAGKGADQDTAHATTLSKPAQRHAEMHRQPGEPEVRGRRIRRKCNPRRRRAIGTSRAGTGTARSSVPVKFGRTTPRQSKIVAQSRCSEEKPSNHRIQQSEGKVGPGCEMAHAPHPCDSLQTSGKARTDTEPNAPRTRATSEFNCEVGT